MDSRTRIRLVIFSGLSLIVLLILMGCSGGGSGRNEVTHYVGEFAGSDAFIGIARNGDGVIAYICDGETIAEWFRGLSTSDGTLNLTSNSGSQLHATLGDLANGSYTPEGGESLSFAAEVAEGEAGLYRLVQDFDGETEVAGWVVLNNGDLRGARVRGTTFIPETMLDPNAVLADPGVSE